MVLGGVRVPARAQRVQEMHRHNTNQLTLNDMRTVFAIVGVLALMTDTATEGEFWTQIVIGGTCLLLSINPKKSEKNSK